MFLLLNFYMSSKTHQLLSFLLMLFVVPRGVWQGVAMDSLKYRAGLPCPTLLRPVGRPPLKQSYVGCLLPHQTSHAVRPWSFPPCLRWPSPPPPFPYQRKPRQPNHPRDSKASFSPSHIFGKPYSIPGPKSQIRIKSLYLLEITPARIQADFSAILDFQCNIFDCPPDPTHQELSVSDTKD
jgi:hypothetical protein